jgi:tellurite resistance protein
MHSENMAILKSLVSVAWADGDYGDKEREMLDALLDAFEATPDEETSLRDYAKTPRKLEDVPLEELSPDDLRVLIQHAVLLTFIDGRQDDKEIEFVKRLAGYLGIPPEESKALIGAAETRALKHIGLLD